MQKNSLEPNKRRESMLETQKELIEMRFGKGFSFYDPESKFCIDLHGLSTYDCPEKVLKSFEPSIERARKSIKLIESGGIANHTEVVHDSENLAVDHFNLRMPKAISPVEGKNLENSLELWKECQQFVKDIEEGKIVNEENNKFKDVIFNGIGGSYLGPYMLLRALSHTVPKSEKTNMLTPHFVANTDPDEFEAFLKQIDIKTAIMVTMSKSGSTKETAGNMLAFNHELEKNGLTVGKHSCAITVKGSDLDKTSQRLEFLHCFHMNQQTGGRTSIVSAIGMVPCAFGHLDFESFIKGMSHMDALTRRTEAKENPAFLYAVGLEQQKRIRGRQNIVYLAYSAPLVELPHYLQQLFMESLGKEYDIDGAIVNEGLTVFGGVGTGEQHAFMQQVQKGIPDSLVRFTYFRERSADYCLKELPPHGTTMGRQFLAFEKGTESALMSNGRDFITTVYQRLDAFNIGMIIALEERVVAVIAAMRRINAFDQPGVQDGKVSAKDFEILAYRVEEALKAKAGETLCGNVLELSQVLGLVDPASESATKNIYMLDAILMDVVNNHKVSWDVKVEEASFDFVEGAFVYTIKLGK